LWNPPPFFPPPPLPATPTILQYYCTTIAQYTPSHRPSLCMPYTIQYWGWQYRVKVKRQRVLAARDRGAVRTATHPGLAQGGHAPGVARAHARATHLTQPRPVFVYSTIKTKVRFELTVSLFLTF